MKVTVVGKGNVGGGLADLWEHAGHEVTRLGSDGGDASDAEVVLFAPPGGAVAAAFETVNEAVEQLIRDAGYEPLHAGPLENASAQESFLKLMFAINRSGVGPFFYRMAPPAEL